MKTETWQRVRTAVYPFIFLGPLVAWLLALGASYLVQDFACANAHNTGSMSGVGWLPPLLTVMNIVLLGVALGAGALAWRLARAAHRDERGEGGATWFVGVVGISVAGFSAFGIVLILVNPIVLAAC